MCISSVVSVTGISQAAVMSIQLQTPFVNKGRTHERNYKMGEMELMGLFKVLLPKLRA